MQNYLKTLAISDCLCNATFWVYLLSAVAASDEAAFASHPTRLLCGVVKSQTADWMYQKSQHNRRQRISVNGTVRSHHHGRYIINGSSLIINEVKASDAGIYTCGHGRQLYHKLQLTVSGVLNFRCCCFIQKIAFNFVYPPFSYSKVLTCMSTFELFWSTELF